MNPEDGILYMIMPFMHHGDVKSFLRSKRGDTIKLDHFPKVLMYMCILKLIFLKGSRDQSSVATAKSRETRNTEDSDIEIINPYFWLATITYCNYIYICQK